ncbi:hypothetical protein [Thiomicrospira sp. WB1]|uniref:hypothetical protein n=1 Tax=Thiomicrospira sp. WB1 TaxID=1685380 RepID=UPI000747AF1A|nr:hypothetical protein [Thiomicrospira sp. WB1]KUJ72739.1 hypothetical protein AVO41_02800 [Thiomicrospira sp. WB1]
MKRTVMGIGLMVVVVTQAVAQAPRLFLSPEQRQNLEAARQGTGATSSPSTPSTTDGRPNDTATPVRISAIIVTPDGRKWVRRNERYYLVGKTGKLTGPMTFELGPSTHLRVGDVYDPKSGSVASQSGQASDETSTAESTQLKGQP